MKNRVIGCRTAELMVFLGCFLTSCPSIGATAATNQQLTRCLTRAEQSPDFTLAEADSWIKRGGGDAAKVCHAFAQFHRGEYEAAAKEFVVLAKAREKKDSHRAASFHAQAGLAAMRAGDHKMAESEYAAALKLEPQDPDIWLDRATHRAAVERYWDALKDVDHALAIMPDMPEALRLRAQIRVRLGLDASAKTDLEQAGTIEGAEGGAKPPER